MAIKRLVISPYPDTAPMAAWRALGSDSVVLTIFAGTGDDSAAEVLGAIARQRAALRSTGAQCVFLRLGNAAAPGKRIQAEIAQLVRNCSELWLPAGMGGREHTMVAGAALAVHGNFRRIMYADGSIGLSRRSEKNDCFRFVPPTVPHEHILPASIFAEKAVAAARLDATPPVDAREFTWELPTLREQDASAIFSKVYARSAWGGGDTFDSGPGSRDPALYHDYVARVTEFLGAFAHKPDVVDLGCGDFNIGRQLRPYARRYVACDVVPDLIAHIRARYSDSDVDFRVLDITREATPPGDVVILRQVLQHLSNDMVSKVVQCLVAYRFAVVSEHVPAEDFIPNVDIASGPSIRLSVGSGLDLEAAPFSLRVAAARELSRVAADEGVIRTMLYQMQPVD